MKKLRIFITLFILAFSFSVKAGASLELDCNSKDISSNNSVKCEGNLSYDNVSINDIELSYETNLDISFLPVSGFTINNSNGKITIHTDTSLEDEIFNVTKIMEFTLSSNNKCGTTEELSFNNIKTNDSTAVISNVKEKFNVIKEQTKLDNICTLNSITIEKELIKDFNKDKLEYRDIKVSDEVIFIDAVRTSDKSSATGLGNVVVPKGDTIERDIVVTAEDGTKNIYKLFITNITPKDEIILADENKDSDNNLKTLEIYNEKKKINFSFDNKKDTFDIKIENEKVDKLTIKATLNSEKATFVKNYEPRDITLDYGENKILIKVKAENDEEKVYILNINYQDNRDKDNTLSSLKINNKEVNLADEKLEVRLSYNIAKTQIEAIANSDKAEVNFEDIDLEVGNNDVNITVTAEDGTTNEYEVNVVREDERLILEKLEVVGYDLEFDKDKSSYDLYINKNDNKLEFKVIPDGIDIEVLNNSNLKNGSKVTIKLKDDEKTYEYTINISKEDDMMNLIGYIVFGIGVVSFISSVIYVLKKNKQ